MGTANGMIRAGRSLLGLHEQPMGSNFVPKVTRWYNAKFHIGTVKFSWCDASITEESYASDNQDAVCGGGGFAYVPSHAQWFRSKGRFHAGARGIRAGDVVFYNWSRRRGTTLCDHVGLVEKVFSDGSFYALEGNHNDAFQRVHRDATYVSGYGRPNYQEDSMPSIKDLVKAVLTTGFNHRGWTVAESLERIREDTAAMRADVTALKQEVADLKAKGV